MQTLSKEREQKISVIIDHQAKGVYRVKGEFYVLAEPDKVWEVLTDYNRLSQMVSSLAQSKVVKQGKGFILLSQTAVIQLLGFKRKLEVLLQVREQPNNKILFEDTLKKDFQRYDGCWQLIPIPGGTKVHYELLTQGAKEPPAALARVLFKSASKSLFASLKAEILKRVKK